MGLRSFAVLALISIASCQGACSWYAAMEAPDGSSREPTAVDEPAIVEDEDGGGMGEWFDGGEGFSDDAGMTDEGVGDAVWDGGDDGHGDDGFDEDATDGGGADGEADGGDWVFENDRGFLEWVVRAGGSYYDTGTDVSAISDGSSFTAGWFDDSATFGPGDPNETVVFAPRQGIFVARYNHDGTLAWVRGSSTETSGMYTMWPVKVSALDDGASIITGMFYGDMTVDGGASGDRTITSESDWDMYLALYDGDGSLDWVVGDGGSGADLGHDVALLGDGSALVSGRFAVDIESSASTTFGEGEANQTTLVSFGNGDIFIARYNPDGTLAWIRSAGSIKRDYGFGIAPLPDESFYMTGKVRDDATFGLGEENETVLEIDSYEQFYVAYYNPDGTLAWVKKPCECWESSGEDIAALPDGTFAIAGFFDGIVTFGAGGPNEAVFRSSGAWGDSFVAKFDPDGELLWARHVGLPELGFARGVALVDDGSVIASGGFYKKCTFDAGGGREITYDIDGYAAFLVKYDSYGNLMWVRRSAQDGYSHTECDSVSALPDGSCIGAGGFGSDTTFGLGEVRETTLSALGQSDAFLWRVGP